MALDKTGIRYSDESCLCLELFDIMTAAVAHTRTQTAEHLEDCISERSLVRNTSLNSLRNKLFVVLLEVSVLTAVCHGGKAAHSAINLKASALEYFCCTRAFLAACNK